MATKPNSQVMRAQAEAVARKKFGASTPSSLTPEDIEALFHELRVHQIQLEMQNEELHNAQLALEESRARYVNLYDFAPVGYCSISEDGGMIMEANLTLTLLLGLPRVALIGKPFARFIVAADQDRFYLFKKSTLAERAQSAFVDVGGVSSHSIELRLNAVDGSILWVRLVAGRTLNLAQEQLRIVVTDISASKRMESELASSERRLREIIETEPECVKLLDAEGRLLEMNATGLRMVEAESFQKIENYCVYGLVNSAHHAAFRALNQRVFQGESGILEFQITGLKGTQLWLETHASPLRDETGRVTASLGITRDITSRKMAEVALRLSDAALKSISQGVLITGIDHRIISINAAFSAITGYTLPEVVGRNCNFLQGPETDPLTVAAIRSALKNLTEFSGEILNYRKIGTYFWNELTISPVFDAQGAVSHYVGVTRDVTPRRLVEKVNQETTMQLRLVIRGGNIGYWDWDVSSNGLVVNDRWFTMLGLDSHGPPPGIDFWHSLVHPDDAHKLAHLFDSVIMDPNGLNGEAEIRARHRAGHYVWILDRFSVVDRASDGKPLRVVGTHLDITEQKLAEAALRQTANTLEQRVIERTQALQAAQLSKTRFFAAASHDLLQPLNAARIFASSLAEQSDLSDTTLNIVHRIDSALRNAEEVIDVLVDVAKLDTGAVQAVIEDVDLGELLAGLLEQFSAIAERRSLQLRIHPCQLIVRSDRRLLRRLLQNIISNALRYTARGSVLVGVRRLAGAQIRIDVHDTGPGIRAEAISQIFEEFQRGGHSSPWGEKGLGLGLAICMRISDLLGHKLSVISVPGRGSTFSLRLGNFRTSSGTVSPPSPVLPTPSSLSRLRVLCVDDNAEVLDAMVTLMRSWDIACERASARASALEVARILRPDVVIVDYQFDDAQSGDGLQIISALRDLYPTNPPVAIMATANRTVELKEITRNLDIALLQKPLRAARLRSLLESISRSHISNTLQATNHFIR